MKPIRTAEDHQAILDEIEGLMGAAPGTPEADRLEILAVLASEYERRTVAQEQEPDPVEVLGIVMRGKGLSQAALSDVIGSRARASEVLSRKRSLSADMIDRVSRAWSIPRRLLSGTAADPVRPARLKKAASVAVIGLSITCAAVASPFILYGRDLPEIRPLVAEAQSGTAASTLPPYVTQAFIAMQDRHFLTHRGYDGSALVRATGRTLADTGHPAGGATLTQQLLKNSLLKDEPRSIRRKVREILLARRLERSLSKDQILGLYLTKIYFGGGEFGIESAARHYFGCSADRLSVAQAAYLASMINAPNTLRVDLPANRARALSARNEALERMERTGFLTPALRAKSAQERIW
ncbi:MAG TPA: transglycosylase domain-containing protein [Sphingomicrobium sp.]|jgi:penicillin-binding protein 1A